MGYSDDLFVDIYKIPAPEGWSKMECVDEGGSARYLQLDNLPENAHITVKTDVAQVYAAICGLAITEKRSSIEIVNSFRNGAYVEMSHCPSFSGLNSCLFYSGFGKADLPESGTTFSILIAHHDNMIGEIRLAVTPAISKSALFPAKEWLDAKPIRKYLNDISKCLAASNGSL